MDRGRKEWFWASPIVVSLSTARASWAFGARTRTVRTLAHTAGGLARDVAGAVSSAGGGDASRLCSSPGVACRPCGSLSASRGRGLFQTVLLCGVEQALASHSSGEEAMAVPHHGISPFVVSWAASMPRDHCSRRRWQRDWISFLLVARGLCG